MLIGFRIPETPKSCPDCGGKLERRKSVMSCTKDRSHGFLLTTEDVTIEMNHTFIAGTTGTGKSKTMRRLIEECEDTILIIDAKRRRDYADLNADIPLYIEQQMEPIVIKDSIETTERFTIRREFATLLDMIVEVETWNEMLDTIERELGKAKGYIRNNLNILKYFIKRLVKEYNKFEWSKTLELHDRINVMDLSEMAPQLQQLVVGSVMRFIQNNLTNITVIIDEAHRFIPQEMSSGCSRDIITFVREGRASSNWLWVADQTITGISKNLLKQMQYWILGRQTEINEVKRTVEQIPRRKSLGITVEMIQTLGIGEFLIACHEWAKKTYIHPLWIDEETAIRVAIGELTAKKVAKMEPKIEEDDKLYKAKYDEERKKTKALRAEIADLKKAVIKPVEKVVEKVIEVTDKKLESELKRLQSEVKKLEKKYQGIIAAKDKQIEDLKFKIEHVETAIENIENLRNTFIDFLGYQGSVGTAIQSAIDEEAIVKKVLSRIPSGQGAVYQVAPLEALKKDWEKRAFSTMIQTLGELPKRALTVLSYLISEDRFLRKGQICKVVFGSTSGSMNQALNDFLKLLIPLGIVENNASSGVRATIDNFIKQYLKDTEDISNYKDHLIAYIMNEVNGDE